MRSSKFEICDFGNCETASIPDKFRDRRLFQSLFGEADGVNTFEDMKEWNANSRDDIIRLMEGYGAKNKRIPKIYNKKALLSLC